MRPDAEIGGAVQHLSVGEAAAHCIDAEFRAEVGAKRDVGGGIAKLPAALVAMLHRAFDGEGAGEEAGGGFRVAGLERLADAAGGNGFAIGLERWVGRLTGAENIREVTLFPRDLTRLAP